MLLRGQNLLGYRHYSDDVVRAFVKKSADNGVDVFRIFDALNDTRNLRVSVEAVKKAGKHAEGTISYTTSPVHDVAHFVGIAKELEAMGSDTIAIKDMAGLLTPQATIELVKA
jgi:pyruvate carboxylase subunit B